MWCFHKNVLNKLGTGAGGNNNIVDANSLVSACEIAVNANAFAANGSAQVFCVPRMRVLRDDHDADGSHQCCQMEHCSVVNQLHAIAERESNDASTTRTKVSSAASGNRDKRDRREAFCLTAGDANTLHGRAVADANAA